LSFAGEAGLDEEIEGVNGAVESSTNVKPLEHGDVFPAASVAVALKVVDESFETATVIPVPVNVVSGPVAAGAPEQSEVVYSFTVEPASAEPISFGLLSFAGEAGLEDETDGVAGSVESST
jgi:hypothetical protein